MKNLVNQISEFYGSKASSYGRFEDDELTYPSSTVLRDIFRDHSIAFVDGTKKLMDVLAGKAMQAPLSKGGYVLMAHGQSSSKEDWLRCHHQQRREQRRKRRNLEIIVSLFTSMSITCGSPAASTFPRGWPVMNTAATWAS